LQVSGQSCIKPCTEKPPAFARPAGAVSRLIIDYKMSRFAFSRNLPRFGLARPTPCLQNGAPLSLITSCLRSLPLAAGLLAGLPALAQDIPLPPPRPPEADQAREAQEPPKPKGPQQIKADPAAIDAAKHECESLFKAGVAEAEFADAIAWDNGCLAAAPVSVTAIKLANGRRIELKPAALLRCPMALAVANWVRDALAPAAKKLGTEIDRIDVAASYACRPRNNVFGALLSEHGKANALDIRSLHFANGATFVIERAQGRREFLAEMRKSACVRFMTVLGPGSDRAHVNHLHVDLQARRNNYKICQWVLPRPEGATSPHDTAVSVEIERRGKEVHGKKPAKKL
jgi:hypothetical protein